MHNYTAVFSWEPFSLVLFSKQVFVKRKFGWIQLRCLCLEELCFSCDLVRSEHEI